MWSLFLLSKVGAECWVVTSYIIHSSKAKFVVLEGAYSCNLLVTKNLLLGTYFYYQRHFFSNFGSWVITKNADPITQHVLFICTCVCSFTAVGQIIWHRCFSGLVHLIWQEVLGKKYFTSHQQFLNLSSFAIWDSLKVSVVRGSVPSLPSPISLLLKWEPNLCSSLLNDWVFVWIV